MLNKLETVTIHNVPGSKNAAQETINAGHGTIEMQPIEVGWRGRAHDVPSIRVVEMYQMGFKAPETRSWSCTSFIRKSFPQRTTPAFVKVDYPMTIYPMIRSLILAIRRFHLPTMNLDLRSPTRLHRIIATNQGTHLCPILPRSIPLAMWRALQRQPMNLSTLPRLLPLATPLCRLPFLPLTLPLPSLAFSLPLAPDGVSYGGVVYALRGGALNKSAEESTNVVIAATTYCPS